MGNVIKVGEVNQVQSLEEFEALLEVYKVKNPAKFAVKEANGEFDKFKAQFGKPSEVVVPEVKKEKKSKS